MSSRPLSVPAVSLEGYGEHVFRGDVAKPYLEKQGLPADILDSHSWCSDAALADKVSTDDIFRRASILTRAPATGNLFLT
jgi:hypothetical protein